MHQETENDRNLGVSTFKQNLKKQFETQINKAKLCNKRCEDSNFKKSLQFSKKKCAKLISFKCLTFINFLSLSH